MEFFLFAGLMGVDMLWFIFLAVRYTYVETEVKQKEEPMPSSSPVRQQQGTVNQAFTDTPV